MHLLFDLPHLSTMYGMFLPPGNLQVDLSFMPGKEFGALGPAFKLIYGKPVEREMNSQIISPQHLFGLTVHITLSEYGCASSEEDYGRQRTGSAKLVTSVSQFLAIIWD